MPSWQSEIHADAIKQFLCVFQRRHIVSLGETYVKDDRLFECHAQPRAALYEAAIGQAAAVDENIPDIVQLEKISSSSFVHCRGQRKDSEQGFKTPDARPLP